MLDLLGKSLLSELRAAFGERLQENVRMSDYTTAHVGGVADALIVTNNCLELESDARMLWEKSIPFKVIGSGSNILVSDKGIRGVVLLNHARAIKVDAHQQPPHVWAESGANIGTIARQVGLRGFSGMEWAASVPGTLGGAIYGNAGAHGRDMQASLEMAEILQHNSDKVRWSAEEMRYGYRTSRLKQTGEGKFVILSAWLRLIPSTPEAVKATMNEYSARRRNSQPPGASMGSMFKNPPGDYAGRLIEFCGLKGARIGGAEISPIHANFFVNHSDATAMDIFHLVKLARETVKEKTGVDLELEIELVGEWDETAFQSPKKNEVR